MRRLPAILLALALLLAISAGTASAAGWDSHYPSPTAGGVGSVETPGPVLKTLTPELKYQVVGELNCIYVYYADDSRLTLAEQRSNFRLPVLTAQINSSSLQIPAGILLPGKNYYWFVESTHALGSKSENSKTSRKLYFSTATDAK